MVLLSYAIALRDKKELELLQDKNGFQLYKPEVKLLEYFKKKITTPNSQSVLNYMTEFYKATENIGEISRSDCECFAEFLCESLEPMTARTYFTIFKSCLNKAVLEQIINTNPANGIRIKAKAPKKEFLTSEEIVLLRMAECDSEIKRAFLFSCYTGLRYSDIIKVKRSDIYNNNLILRQKKTQDVLSVPLHKKAREIVDMTDSGQLFTLPSPKTLSQKVKDWVKNAGIEKHVTFHTARHSFVTLLLSAGVDIYTVSKLAGHRSIKSTMVYANLVDQARSDAIQMLPI